MRLLNASTVGCIRTVGWEKEVGILGLLGTIDLVDSNDEVTVGWLDIDGIVSAEADFVG